MPFLGFRREQEGFTMDGTKDVFAEIRRAVLQASADPASPHADAGETASLSPAQGHASPPEPIQAPAGAPEDYARAAIRAAAAAVAEPWFSQHLPQLLDARLNAMLDARLT